MGKKKKKLNSLILLRDGFISTILSLTVCYLISLLFFNISFFNPISKALQDFSFLDVYYSERLNVKDRINTDIVLINVEHKDREEIGAVLEQILDAKPEVVGFDIILKDFKKTKGDSLLAALLKSKEVITAVVVSSQGLLSNHPFFRVQNDPGFVNFNFDTQNAVIREFDSKYDYLGDAYESFSMLIAKSYLSEKKWKKNKCKDKLQSTSVINYQGDLNHFVNFTIDEFSALENKTLIKDKIVLMGYLGTPTSNSFDVEDKHFTPLNETTAGKSLPDMFGLVIHANIIAMIIDNSFMFKIPTYWLVLITFIFSFLASVYFIWLDRRLKISYRTVRKSILFVFTVLLVWSTLVLFKNGIVLKSAPIIAVTIFSAGFVKYYKHLVRYVNTKKKFTSYLK